MAHFFFVFSDKMQVQKAVVMGEYPFMTRRKKTENFRIPVVEFIIFLTLMSLLWRTHFCAFGQIYYMDIGFFNLPRKFKEKWTGIHFCGFLQIMLKLWNRAHTIGQHDFFPLLDMS